EHRFVKIGRGYALPVADGNARRYIATADVIGPLRTPHGSMPLESLRAMPTGNQPAQKVKALPWSTHAEATGARLWLCGRQGLADELGLSRLSRQEDTLTLRLTAPG